MKQIDGEEASRLLMIDRLFNYDRGTVCPMEVVRDRVLLSRGRLVDDEPNYEPEVEERYRRRQPTTTEHVS